MTRFTAYGQESPCNALLPPDMVSAPQAVESLVIAVNNWRWQPGAVQSIRNVGGYGDNGPMAE